MSDLRCSIETLGYVEKSNHYYQRLHMEAYEETDNCGTCDGADCANCKPIFIVEDYKNDKILYRGGDSEEAVRIAGYDFVSPLKKRGRL